MGTPFIGQLMLVSFNFPPKGFAFCNGQLLPINANQALFSLIGTVYGGNGQTNFALPNLQARTPIGYNNQFQIGQISGEDAHTLVAGEVPSHTHQLQATSTSAGTGAPAQNSFAVTSGGATFYTSPTNLTALNGSTVSTVGGQAHENRQPFLAMNWCIALVGIFPSRN
jgi:microcystin-dependent protein